METAYMVCAAIGGTLIVCQFLVTMLGLGGHHDVGGHDGGGHDMIGHDTDASAGHDTADHHHTEQSNEANWVFSLLTFRTLTAAAAFFGLAGLACLRLEIDETTSFGIAILAAITATVSVGWMMRTLSRLNVDGTIRIERALGSQGTVYLSVPAAKSGAGKVHVNVVNRTIEYKAITAQEQLPTGTKIVVLGIVSADTVEVAPATESERTSHAATTT